MRAQAAAWAERFDAHSLLILRKAADRFDTTGKFDRIRARVLYVIARTDVLFPPSIVPDVMARLKAAGVDATYFEIDTEYGHTASGADWKKWEAPAAVHGAADPVTGRAGGRHQPPPARPGQDALQHLALAVARQLGQDRDLARRAHAQPFAGICQQFALGQRGSRPQLDRGHGICPCTPRRWDRRRPRPRAGGFRGRVRSRPGRC